MANGATDPILVSVERECAPYQNCSRFWLAYSGGLDSSVLLDLLTRISWLKPKLQLIHIDHGWNGASTKWAMQCETAARRYQLPIQVVKLNLPVISEENARHARYQIFENLLSANEVLLMAHQQDDQAETVLLRLFRGAGNKGLAAMPIKRRLGLGLLLRPLLAISRSEILDYSKLHQLDWIEDPSNQDEKFRRNYLRRKIFPLIQAKWPEIKKTLANTAIVIDEQNHLLKNFILETLKTCEENHALKIDPLKKFPLAVRKALIIAWLEKQGIGIRSQAWLDNLMRSLMESRSDATPEISLDNFKLRRSQNKIFLVSEIHLPNQIHWGLKFPLEISGLGKITAVPTQNTGIRIAADENIYIRFWKMGERFHPHNRAHSNKLKKLWQEWGVPVWQRRRIPLIYSEDELLAVANMAYAKHRLCQQGEAGWIFLWEPVNENG